MWLVNILAANCKLKFSYSIPWSNEFLHFWLDVDVDADSLVDFWVPWEALVHSGFPGTFWLQTWFFTSMSKFTDIITFCWLHRYDVADIARCDR